MFKFKSIFFYSLLVAGFFASGSAAHAAVTTFNFGSLLTASAGYKAPNNFASHPFAQLETVNNGNVWTFTLSVNNNLFSSFGDKACICSISFDFNPDPVNQPVSTFISSNVGGVTTVASFSGSGNSGLSDIDFGTLFGKSSKDRLSQNDYVSWSVSGLAGTSYVNSYVHVQGIDGGYSAKYTPQGVTAEQLAALNAEAVRTKTASDDKKAEYDTKKSEADRTETERVSAETLAAAAKKAMDDALAAAAEQARIADLAAAAKKAMDDALAAAAAAEQARKVANQARDDALAAALLAAEAEQAKLDAEDKKASEDDFRDRVLARDHSSDPTCVTPVPEPETYAMMLAGLGLIGFTARRRKQNT